jgi:hypothetical protein
LWFRSSHTEGFAEEKEPSPHPLVVAQTMLRQAMVPIRKVAKYALDTDSIMERFQQRNKSPMELAREYLKKQQQ